MGVTYRAVDTSLKRPVALKLIDSEWAKRGAEARERFMREARTAASLRHPNIATVYHFGIREENGQCFCAMELVEGETLEMRVRRTGPLDALTTIEIALQVSSALAEAEKQGLVHRDLKPANLMLVAAAPDTNDSNPGNAEKAETVVKVIDFGVAKALVEKPDAMGLTHGGFVGTPAFASPEQFTDAPVGVRSDIYSLGATLWYLLTGHRPFEGATIEQIRASQHSQALPIEQLKAARVPSRLVSLLVSMLAAEPAARPDVRALTSQLQDCRAQMLDRWKAARRFALAAGLIGITVAAFLIFERQNRTISQNTVLSNVSEKTVAVLPFESLSEDKGNAYFAGGVRDEILTKLAQVRGLKVMSRSSTKKNASHPTNLPELGRQLGTDSFLEGSVRNVAGDLSIHVQLMDAKTGRQLWAQSYQRPGKDISEVEGEVAHQVAGFETPTTLKVSSNFYDGTTGSPNEARWGDWAGVGADPLDNSFWVTHEWAKTTATDAWGTWVANVSTANLDSDGDGFTDLEELQAGTDPLNPASAPGITSTDLIGSDVQISFSSVAGKSYLVERNQSFPIGSWTVVANNVAGTGGIVQVIDPGAAGLPKQYYRVQVLP
jgi:serine/threonine protein kinase